MEIISGKGVELELLMFRVEWEVVSGFLDWNSRLW